jgi:hypothetical protein
MGSIPMHFRQRFAGMEAEIFGLFFCSLCMSCARVLGERGLTSPLAKKKGRSRRPSPRYRLIRTPIFLCFRDRFPPIKFIHNGDGLLRH